MAKESTRTCSKQPPRKYSSPLREEQALQTRLRILDATEKLLLERGYAKTTIEAIAAEAGVSAQTIYVAFKDKRGIMGEVIGRAFDDDFMNLVDSSLVEEDPRKALRLTVDLLVKAHQIAASRFNLLSSAGILSSEMAKIQEDCEREEQNYHAEHMRSILRNATLKLGLSMNRAIDISWFIGHRTGYQTFVVERGWSGAEYAEWVYGALTNMLLE